MSISFHFQYNYKKMIHMMLENFFESISKCEFNYSDELKTRDCMHLYEFQKYFLYKSMKRLMNLVKEKQQHYWNEKIDVTPWHGLSESIIFINFVIPFQ